MYHFFEDPDYFPAEIDEMPKMINILAKYFIGFLSLVVLLVVFVVAVVLP